MPLPVFLDCREMGQLHRAVDEGRRIRAARGRLGGRDECDWGPRGCVEWFVVSRAKQHTPISTAAVSGRRDTRSGGAQLPVLLDFCVCFSPPRTGATEGAMRGGVGVRSLTGAQNGGQTAGIMNVSR